jgi:ribosomal protein L17
MKKQNSVKKLGKPAGMRNAMIRSQVNDLLNNGHVKTTKARAQVVAQRVDSLMAFVDQKNEKMLIELIANKALLAKVKEFKTEGKKSGFVSMRTIKNRPGDNAEVVLLELLVK